MNLSSTRFQSPVVSFRQALFAGQAPDGGLYMPQHFPRLPLERLAAMTDYQEFAGCVLNALLKDEIDPLGIEQVVHAAYPFAPVVAEIKPALFTTDCIPKLFVFSPLTRIMVLHPDAFVILLGSTLTC